MSTSAYVISLILLVVSFVLSIFLVNTAYKIWMKIIGADAMFFSGKKKWTAIVVVTLILWAIVVEAIYGS